MIEGFKKFIARGNMIDMAVGVVMGGAVTTVVNSIVNNVINPFIAMIFGKPNMDGLLAITFNNATVSFGAVLGAILNFLIIAAALVLARKAAVILAAAAVFLWVLFARGCAGPSI